MRKVLALRPMAARPMDGATWWQLPWTLNKPLQVSPLSGHLARHPIILASKTALPAQRPESQVHGGEIDWPCHSIVIDRQFLKAGPLMVINAGVGLEQLAAASHRVGN